MSETDSLRVEQDQSTQDRKRIDLSFRRLRTMLFLFPFLVSCFHDVHLIAYVQLFSAKVFTSADQIQSFKLYDGSSNLLFMVMFVLYPILMIWYRPIHKLHVQWKNGQIEEDNRELCAHRMENILTSVIKVYVLILLLKLGYRLFSDGSALSTQEVFIVALPAHIFGMSAELTFAMTYALGQKFGFSRIFQVIYPGEKLYEEKKGAKLTTVTLVRTFFLTNFILPITAMLIVRMYHMDADLDFFFSNVVGAGLYQILVVSAVGMVLLDTGLNKPIQELISKMKQVESGDLDVRTTVMFNDEVSSLKVQFNKMVEGIRKQEELKELFGRYMSSSVALKLIEEGQIKLGGDKIQAAVMFSDIRGFTTLSESMSPEEVVQFLNRYFQYITKPILENGGMINKYIGDCVMVVFAPIFDCEDFADKALLAAKGMREELKRFQKDYPEYNANFGIGIHVGPLVAGNIGTQDRSEYTVIGDTVNVAARLESETKAQGVDLLFSEDLVESLKEPDSYLVKEVETITVKGRSAPLKVLTLEM